MPMPLGEIRRLNPTLVGTMVGLRCPCCQADFDVFQPTLVGVSIGSHSCPVCATVLCVTPGSFSDAIETNRPVGGLEREIELTEEATRIAETWHQEPTWNAIFQYRGVPLGEASERVLVGHVAVGLNLATADREGTT